MSLLVWCRVARATGTDLRAFLDAASAAGRPRDAVHLRAQELIIQTAAIGGWTARPEQAIDSDPQRTRAVDVYLRRLSEHGLVEIWDWFDDVGASFRSWDRRLARIEQAAIARMSADGGPLPTASGCWAVRATRGNRQLVGEHRAVFASRFPCPGSAWLAALASAAPMPSSAGLLWITVQGDRLVPVRIPFEPAPKRVSPAASREPRRRTAWND